MESNQYLEVVNQSVNVSGLVRASSAGRNADAYEGVQAFLEKQHVATPARLKKLLAAEGRGPLNFLYTGASADDLIRALDPAWPGPLPHTVLIAPGGKILYRHNGQVDPEELKNEVLKHLGPYYTPGEKR